MPQTTAPNTAVTTLPFVPTPHETRTRQCERCDTANSECQLATGARGGEAWLCATCRERCEICHQNYSVAHHLSELAGGDRICTSCLNSGNYTTCTNCAEIVSSSETYRLLDSAGRYCRSCYNEFSPNDDDDDEDTELDDDGDPIASESRSSHRTRHMVYAPINAYNYRPANVVLYPAIGETVKADTQFLGIEIEADKGGTSESNVRAAGLYPNDFYYVKRDGSVPRGFEVVSMPATYKYWLTQADFDWTRALKDMVYRSYDTDTCGMHIHVSRASVSYLTIYKLLRFMSLNQGFILKMSRRQNKDRLDKFSGITRGQADLNIYQTGSRGRQLVDKIRRENAAYNPKGGSLVVEAVSRNNHENRYKALNLENEKTIEFRIFRGTLDIAAIKRNIAFVVALCGFMKYVSLKVLDPKLKSKPTKEGTMHPSLIEFFRFIRSGNGHSLLGKEQATDLMKWCISKVPLDKQHD